MDHLFIMPVVFVDGKTNERFSETTTLCKKEQSGIDKKVQGFVQEKISGEGSSLLVSMTMPLFLPDIQLSKRSDAKDKKKKTHLPHSEFLRDPADEIPLGLFACGASSWMNAVMQILLRLPIFRTILALWAPQSYAPFHSFIDQYDADRRATLATSSANSRELVQCLANKMSFETALSGSGLNLFEIFRTLLLSCTSGESTSSEMHSVGESCFLLQWDADALPLAAFMHETLKKPLPSHLLVFVKKRRFGETTIAKQIADEKGPYYDLRGFIEWRQEEALLELIAYVKVAGKSWYQCRNERISKLQSIHLRLPLQSSHLLYYRKDSFR